MSYTEEEYEANEKRAETLSLLYGDKVNAVVRAYSMLKLIIYFVIVSIIAWVTGYVMVWAILSGIVIVVIAIEAVLLKRRITLTMLNSDINPSDRSKILMLMMDDLFFKNRKKG
jgi:hypothetical protein